MYSVQNSTSDGTLVKIILSIEYFSKDDISLYRGTSTTPLVLGVDWAWDGDTAINLLNGPEPAGTVIVIRRETEKDRAYNIYDGGAAFNRESLDENFKQMIYLAQEFTEGSGLTGLYRPFNMNGYRITNLGTPVDASDAVTKKYVDDVNTGQDLRIGALENTFVGMTATYPYALVLPNTTDTIAPPFIFDRAQVFVDGVYQVPGYSFEINNNVITMAEDLPAGTLFSAVLGESILPGEGVVSTAQFGAYTTAQALVDTAQNNRLTALETDTIPIDRGGTGATTADDALANLGGSTPGIAVFKGATAAAIRTTLAAAASGDNADITSITGSAATLTTGRTFITNLGSTTATSFNGSANNSHGVTGTLSAANGGTGATTASAAWTALVTARTPSAARTDLGLGTAAQKDVGTIANTVAAGDDSRFGTSKPGSLIGVQVFNSSAPYTPTPGTASIIIELQGAGGQGGGATAATLNMNAAAAQGGGGGGYVKSRLTSGFTGQTVTIGAGGAGAAAGANGNNGSATTFGTLSAGGGLGGLAMTAASYGLGPSQANSGVATGGNLINALGVRGFNGVVYSMNGAFCQSGRGGGCVMFPGGAGAAVTGANGSPATALGCGGGGAATAGTMAATAGGAGGNGYAIIYEYQ